MRVQSNVRVAPSRLAKPLSCPEKAGVDMAIEAVDLTGDVRRLELFVAPSTDINDLVHILTLYQPIERLNNVSRMSIQSQLRFLSSHGNVQNTPTTINS